MFWLLSAIFGLVFGLIGLVFRVAFGLLKFALLPVFILLALVKAGGSLLGLLFIGLLIAGFAVCLGVLRRA